MIKVIGMQMIIVLICICCLGMGNVAFAQISSSNDPDMIPDNHMRMIAQSIDENSIETIVFSGQHFGPYYRNQGLQIVVSDRKLINTFLTALRHAYSPPGDYAPGNLIDELRIVERAKRNGKAKTTIFYFNSLNEYNCFGPEFYSALHLLEIYRAKQVRMLVRNFDVSKIEEISLIGEKEFDITIPETIERITNVLDEVTDQAFTFRDSTVVHFTLRITFKDKTVERIRFSFVDPTNIKPTKLPLPSILWQYYQKSKIVLH